MEEKMITIQYNPTKNLFKVETDTLGYWRPLGWLQSMFAHRMIPYDWQAVIDNPQQKFFI